MKLIATIKARADGTVVFAADSGSEYVFSRNADGDIEGDVSIDADAAQALRSGNFYPATEADEALAASLLGTPDGDIEGDDRLEDLNAAPVEANTQPKPRGRAKH